jgi:hypothetical protein
MTDAVAVADLNRRMALVIALTQGHFTLAKTALADGDVTLALRHLSLTAGCLPNLSAGIAHNAKELGLT